jgi:hypothetical protein
MEAPLNRGIDPSSPLMLICLFCNNIFFSKREVIFPLMDKLPMVNWDCPLCKDIPLQILGLHPGAWSGNQVVGKPIPESIS